MWCGTTIRSPSFKIEVQLVSIIRIWFFSSGGVTNDSPDFQFWLNKLKDFIHKQQEKVLGIYHYLIAIYLIVRDMYHRPHFHIEWCYEI